MALSDNTPCTYCGMTGAAGEYHSYGVCLMMKACNNSETVRANLAAMREHYRAEARRDALEEAAQAVEAATYRKRWARAAVNGQARNVPPCELAAAIRALKEKAP